MKNADKPAYPTNIAFTEDGKGHAVDFFDGGLTKRERFAMAAMQSLISMRSDDYWMPEEIAEDSVQYAGALLKELGETNV